jgi:acyl transferase domain-containing protein
VLSESGYSHPFDDQAEGLGRAEGLGCVVLRRMADAERDTQHVVAALVNATAGAAGPVEGACS